MFGVCVCVCVCGTVKKREKNSVWIQIKKNSVCTVKNVPVYADTTRTCVSTCARGAGVHGDVLNVHTEGFFDLTHGDVFEWTREQHVADSSNHSLCLSAVKLVRFVSSWMWMCVYVHESVRVCAHENVYDLDNSSMFFATFLINTDKKKLS